MKQEKKSNHFVSTVVFQVLRGHMRVVTTILDRLNTSILQEGDCTELLESTLMTSVYPGGTGIWNLEPGVPGEPPVSSVNSGQSLGLCFLICKKQKLGSMITMAHFRCNLSQVCT